jgi:peptidylprolyl isomerase
MRFRHLAAALVLFAMAGGSLAQDTTSEKGKLSYALGYQTGRDIAQLARRGETVDMATLINALQDGAAGKDPAVPAEQLQVAVDSMQRRQLARDKAAFDQTAADNKTRSEAFLARNRQAPGVQVLPSGIQYRVLRAGTGTRPTQGSEVQVHYTTRLPDGQVLAETRTNGAGQASGPLSVRIAEVQMQGLKQALLAMDAGARWEVVLPPALASGTGPDAGRLVNQALVFDIELVSIRP